ncbi:MAG: hypothetical protein AAFX87_24985 [Bacteroidota bacterium]
MRELFEVLKTTLEAIDLPGNDELFVDIYNNQLEKRNNRPLPYPVVLVEFKTAEYIQLGRGIQKGTFQIIFHIADEIFANNGRSDTDRALEFLDLKETIHRNLQGIEISNFTRFIRKEENQWIDEDIGETGNQDRDYDRLLVFELTYETVHTDTSTHQDTQFVNTDPENLEVDNISITKNVTGKIQITNN